MTGPSDIDIVIVNWNAGELLQKCIRSVGSAVQGSGLVVKLIVVDNDSSDQSAANLQSPECPLVVVRNIKNVGFGAACNQGAREGHAEFLLFLNPDTEISAENLREPVAFLREPANARYGVCGIQLRDESGDISRSCARIPTVFQLLFTSVGLAQAFPGLPFGIPMTDWDHRSSRDVDHVIGAFYLIRRTLFSAVGGFDERYFVYLEDLDLSLRVRQAGYVSRYLTSTFAHHVGGGTSRQIKARRLFYSIDSRLTFLRRHFGRICYLAFLPVVLHLLS